MGLDSGSSYFQITEAGESGGENGVVQPGWIFAITDPSEHAAIEEGVTTDHIGVVRAYGPGGANQIAARK
jgi:hypothetical protein